MGAFYDDLAKLKIMCRTGKLVCRLHGTGERVRLVKDYKVELCPVTVRGI